MTIKKRKVWVQLDTIVRDDEPMTPDELIAAIQHAVQQATTDQLHHTAENPRTQYEKLVVRLDVDADHEYEECNGYLRLIGIRDETEYEVQRRQTLHEAEVAGARRRLEELEKQVL